MVVSENDNGSNISSNFYFGGIFKNSLGLGIPGVTLDISNSLESFEFSDENGTFLLNLESGWSISH